MLCAPETMWTGVAAAAYKAGRRSLPASVSLSSTIKMRLIAFLSVVVALAGLAAGFGTSSSGGGRSLNFAGYVGGLRGGRSSRLSYGHGNDPYGFFISFLDPYLRHQEFTWWEAQYQCAIRGLQLVSLDSYYKDYYVAQLIHYYGVRWIWTSGTRRGYYFIWGNGNPVGYYYSNWSHTGSKGYPQPDNAEGNEYCLAVLNNFYHDGIVWHDIACHHRKAFICERPYYTSH